MAWSENSESSKPLLEAQSPSEDDGSASNSHYFAPRPPLSELAGGSSMTGENSDNGRIYTPPTTEATSPTISQEADFVSDAEPLLGDHAPPPSYEEIDTNNGSWRDLSINQGHPQTIADLPKTGFLGANYVSENTTAFQHKFHAQFSVLKAKIDNWRQNRRSKREGRSRLKRAAFILGVFFSMIACGFLLGWAIVTSVQCHRANYVYRDYQLDKIESFHFGHTDKANVGLPKGFSGSMHVLTGPAGQVADLNVSIRATEHELRGGDASGTWRPGKLQSCAEIYLYFRPGLEISQFEVDSRSLSLEFSSDLIITDATTIRIKSGIISAESFVSSHKTYIDIRSSSIRGKFGLHDLLSVKSGSGSINIDIVPKESLDGGERPAVIDIDSSAGQVEINYPGNYEDIPNREYHTSMLIRSGRLAGNVLHGYDTTLGVTAGALEVQIIPYGDGQQPSSLTTNMESGHSSVEILKPASHHPNPLKNLTSSHIARSGRLQLKYPSEWQGTLSGEISSGSFDIYGSALRSTVETSNGVYKTIQAKNGNGDSQMKFEISSGSGELTVGY